MVTQQQASEQKTYKAILNQNDQALQRQDMEHRFGDVSNVNVRYKAMRMTKG